MYLKTISLILATAGLAACSTLPSSGPTGTQIKRGARMAAQTEAGMAIEIVTVDTMLALPPAERPVQWDLPLGDPQPSDMIGPGDVLSVTIFEAGVSLFSAEPQAAMAGAPVFDPGVRSQTLPPSRVDDQGEIMIPYVGRLRVAGRTGMEVEELIRQGLRTLSQDPQVLVNREQIITNTVIVGGEVEMPGRLVLETNRESMADAIALSGGYRGNAKDLVLRIRRGENGARLRLSDVMAGAYEDLQVYPGDRLTVLEEPMMFSVLGASGRVQQLPFARDSMSVIEAIAAAGGPNASAGDPKAVFVFRYEGPDRTRPVVYHFNMMRTASFFLAQQFSLRDGDVLYFGNAASNQPRLLVQTIGQLFAPIVTLSAVANTLGN